MGDESDEITFIPTSTGNKSEKINSLNSLTSTEINDTDKLLEEILEGMSFKQKTVEANGNGIQELLAQADKDAKLLAQLEKAINDQDAEIESQVDKLEKLERQLQKVRMKKVVKPIGGGKIKPNRYDRQIENLYMKYALDESSSSSS